MKKTIWILAAMLVLAALAYLGDTGLMRNDAVFVEDYAVAEDGSAITLEIGVADSAGYIRRLAIHQQGGGKLYLVPYAAFGGINGSIGAESRYTLPLAEDTTSIALYRADNAYEVVLQKDADGLWQRTK